MRSATIVLVAYVILLVLGALWYAISILPDTRPDIAAIVAAYLGLTARRSVAAAVGASIVVGYLADLLAGTPVGLQALVAGVICILGHLVHRRIVVRGLRVTLAFSLLVGVSASLLVAFLRWVMGEPTGGAWFELVGILAPGIPTALLGPPMLRLLRRIDAAFARTHREKDAALEGLVP